MGGLDALVHVAGVEGGGRPERETDDEWDRIFGINAKVEVVKMQNWSRGLYGDATGLPWVLPSPNIPTVDAAVVYPSAALHPGPFPTSCEVDFSVRYTRQRSSHASHHFTFL